MYKHPVKKTISLIVLYSIIIIGIFVLQFRNESVISKNLGNLSFSLAQTISKEGESSLKNYMAANYKGISFSADEVHPLKLLLRNGSEENLSLVSYKELNSLSVEFEFTNETFITFTSGENNSLTITSKFPADAESVSLYYKPASGFSVTEKNLTKLNLSSKNLTYTFVAPKINDSEITFTNRNSLAYYSLYDPSTVFSYAAIDDQIPIAQKSNYEANIKNLKAKIISGVGADLASAKIPSEKAIAAYIAEMISQNKYTEALSSIPDSYKKGNKRTYFTAPYFGNLEQMNSSLVMHNENMDNLVTQANLNTYSADGIAEYIHITDPSKNINNLLAAVHNIDSDDITLTQAAGILKTYIKLLEMRSSMASDLENAARISIEKIEHSSLFEDSFLTLQENESKVSALLAIEAGQSVLSWGILKDSKEHETAGYCILNTAFAQNTIDLNTMCELYPTLVKNQNYPHFQLLYRGEGKNIWAWTVSSAISYTERNNTATVSIRFPQNYIHHLFIKGIPPFSDIDIYNQPWHADPSFERYNSSGFIYRNTGKMLYLKSRHKAETEEVKLIYR